MQAGMRKTPFRFASVMFTNSGKKGSKPLKFWSSFTLKNKQDFFEDSLHKI